MNYRNLPIAIFAIFLTACNTHDETYMVGTLERDRIEIRVESNEPIIAIHVHDGQMLQAGDLILEQDPMRLEKVLTQQLALRDQAAARLAELERGPRPEAIREARARLESAQASAQNAADSLVRAEEIYARNLSDQATLDLATMRRKTTLAAEQAAKESLATLLNGTTVEELQQAAAALKAAGAAADRAQLDLDRLQLFAPVDGMLDKRLYQLGERPQVGATIAVILDAARSYARIYVPEPRRSAVQPGEQLDVKIDGHERTLKGTVRWVSADASFTPYFALTEHDRSRLSYLAEVDVPDAASIPSGVPLKVDFPAMSPGND
jgi:HlyD family secretion protein